MSRHKTELSVLGFAFSDDFKQVVLCRSASGKLLVPGGLVLAEEGLRAACAQRVIESVSVSTKDQDWHEFARVFCDGRERGLPREYETACFWAQTNVELAPTVPVTLALGIVDKFHNPDHHWLLALAHGVASGRSAVTHYACEEQARRVK